jgi:UDP-glucose:(heptosyl)LPS alpha-1,3-glucosyltransferase
MNFRLKGVLETIRAYGRFHRRQRGGSDRLVVLGNDYVDGYRRIAVDSGVGPEVLFRSPAEDIWPAYAVADAVVLLSWYDPCSRVVLEATAFGVPCITTRFNGAAEAIVDGAGIVVPSPASVDAVAAGMGRLADPAVRAIYADACRAIAPSLSMDRHVDELLDVYEGIIAGKGR